MRIVTVKIICDECDKEITKEEQRNMWVVGKSINAKHYHKACAKIELNK